MSLDPAVLERCRVAILGQRDAGPVGGSGSRLPTLSPLSPLGDPPASVTRREAVPVVPTVRLRAESESAHSRPEAPSWPSCEAVIGNTPLRRGARRMFWVLQDLAVMAARARGYAVCPDTVTLHVPQGLLAAAMGYSDRHVRRLLPELEEAGLIACGAHASLVNDMRLWDGYLWSVKVKPGSGKPALRREEWRHHWRDFAGDMASGRTVKALLEQMSVLQAEERKKALGEALKAWAVSPLNTSHPVACSADTSADEGVEALQDVREVAYRLGELAHVPASKQAEWVGRTASVLARLLNDLRSRRWYCRLLWDALAAEREGRGGLGTLAAALTRLEADRAEWAGLRNPAALLTARLRSVA